MAKVGAGDPRWIVQDRKDGANVNAWHWEERNLAQQVHGALRETFTDLSLIDKADGMDFVKVIEISEVSGDVTVAQRKGKMMCYFELKLTLKWLGRASGATEDVSGKMIIPEVDHDEFRNEYEVSVTCQESTPMAQKVENWVRQNGRTKVRQQIEAYIDTIFEEYHIGTVLKNGSSLPPPAPIKEQTKSAAPTGDTGEETSFCWKMRWHVPIEELFAALTCEQRARMYTRGPAKIDPTPGGQFEFLGGVISGTYVDLQAPTLIRQRWRLGSWPSGTMSSVVLQLHKDEPGVTLLEFAQSGIPSGQLKSVQEGWRANFFEAIKIVCGFTMEYI